MGRLVAILVLAFSVGVGATDWSLTLENIEQKVLRVSMQGETDGGPGTCSGVVINKDAGFLLTAAHCVEGRDVHFTVDKTHAEVVRTNRLLDLAVLRFEPKADHKAVRLAQAGLKMGQEVAVVGFPFGDEKLHSQFGHIARKSTEDELWVNADIIPGDSGGALLNAAGELVGLNVAVRTEFDGAAHMGVAVPLEALREFVKPYLPKE